MPTFDDANIEELFGAEDAENERPERFKEYFYYNHAYESLIAELPVRILVGHKGVGKSALLKRAFLARIRRITHKSVGPEARFRYHFQ
jgi:predicted ATPase